MSQMSTYAQDYLPYFHRYQDEYFQRLESLVNIDSGTGQVEGINRVMDYLLQWLVEAGFVVELHPSAGFGNNLVARRQGKGTVRMLLVGHVDTVYPAGAVQAQPFAIKDGVVSGPGVLDMKSGVLLAVYVVRALLAAGFEQYKELVLVFNNDEEVGSRGSIPLLREIARDIDYALVLEPAGKPGSLTHSRKGTDKYVLEVHGIAAHSGAEPFKGRSAVVELAHKILAIQNLHAMFPGVTFNVTNLSSNEPLNVVPDMARCSISVRSFYAHGLDVAAAALEKIAGSSSVPDTRSTLLRTTGRPPYQPTPEVLRLVELAEMEALTLGVQLKAEPKGGVSDANILIDAGVPTLDTLGPVGGGMHNLEREHMLVDSMPIRGALVAGLLQHICLSDHA
ncbi:M20 family metallopeptidase [Dictyobacter arantiisoli]|uniref:Glutamate carboxypeptidase n=1 Tax=Dictyobacter arantiisoli TaxID=2014874 RepID=A0A5A5TAT7_9CHLR|nr:M20 family metallopeptidase [Dictyobacter arantiisoli]GCF08276.1 glutamate carboxypeptidase [Dictyobacter arantiisoli]